jgi:hypothetical protein
MLCRESREAFKSATSNHDSTAVLLLVNIAHKQRHVVLRYRPHHSKS